MATLFYAEDVHIIWTRARIPIPYFCVGQESESVPESVSSNVNETVSFGDTAIRGRGVFLANLKLKVLCHDQLFIVGWGVILGCLVSKLSKSSLRSSNPGGGRGVREVLCQE